MALLSKLFLDSIKMLYFLIIKTEIKSTKLTDIWASQRNKSGQFQWNIEIFCLFIETLTFR